MTPRTPSLILWLLLLSVLFAPHGRAWAGAPVNPQAEEHFNQAMDYNKTRSFAKARAELIEAVTLAPEVHKYHQALVLNYIQMREGPAGVKFYSDFIKTHPRNPTVHYWLGRLYLDKGSLKEAAEEFAAATELDPKDDHAFIALGHAYWRMGMVDEALKAYLEANRLAPAVASVHGGLGNVYFKKGDYKKAQAEYERAVELETMMPEARFNLGVIYEKGRQYDKAIAQWKAILDEDPNVVQARERLADLYLTLEQYENAAREYSMITRLKPLSDETFVSLGESLILLAGTQKDPGEMADLRDSAVDAFEKALEIDSENKAAQDYLKRLKPPAPPAKP